MSYDSALIYREASRWAAATFKSMPRDTSQPVVWVDAQSRLNLYHPAVPSWREPISPPFEWDELTFQRAVVGLRSRGAEMVQAELEDKDMPLSYFGGYVEACQLEDAAQLAH